MSCFKCNCKVCSHSRSLADEQMRAATPGGAFQGFELCDQQHSHTMEEINDLKKQVNELERRVKFLFAVGQAQLNLNSKNGCVKQIFQKMIDKATENVSPIDDQSLEARVFELEDRLKYRASIEDRMAKIEKELNKLIGGE